MKECYKPKTSDEIQKASEEYIFKTRIDNASVQDHFIAGAEWMLDNPTGGALLYAVVKTTERTKKEMIEKATEWLKEKCCSFWIEDFKQAMQDECK